MAEEQTAPPEPSLAEQTADLCEKVARLVPDAVALGEDGPVLDFDLLTRLLLQRAIPYRMMNRELMAAELHIVRDEQSVQQTKADNARDAAVQREHERRVDVLRKREQTILNQLWPLS